MSLFFHNNLSEIYDLIFIVVFYINCVQNGFYSYPNRQVLNLIWTKTPFNDEFNFLSSRRVTPLPKQQQWSFVRPQCGRRRPWRLERRLRATSNFRRWAFSRSSPPSFRQVWRHRLWRRLRRRWFKSRVTSRATNFRERSFSLVSRLKSLNLWLDLAFSPLVAFFRQIRT